MGRLIAAAALLVVGVSFVVDGAVSERLWVAAMGQLMLLLVPVLIFDAVTLRDREKTE